MSAGRPLRLRRLIRGLFAGALVVAVACGGSSGSSGSRSARIILEHRRFAPDTLTVAAGTKVNFLLVNSDTEDHEFVLGSEELQADHERMRATGEHMAMGSGSAGVPAGKTVRLSYTFRTAGPIIFGCHIDSHYAEGMKGTVTVTS